MRNLLHEIINRGVKQDDDMEVRRQIGLLNMASFLCFATMSFFVALNIIQHKWVLLISNSVLITLTASLLFIRRFKHLDIIIFVLALLFSLYFFFAALLFHNGINFAIITVMVISVLAINNKPARICILIVQITLFTAFMYYQKTPTVVPTLPSYRSYITIILLLVTLACMLEYFKSKHLQYVNNLNKVNNQLRESNRVKERMLSILSHDFNAPVGNLVASLDLFNSDMITEAQFRNNSVKLKNQLQVLTTSLGDVLYWSKMQIVGDAGEAENIFIHALMQEIVPLFQHSAEEKSIILQCNINHSITAWANKDHLKLILRNLLSNAIKFSHTGGNIFFNAVCHEGNTTISITDEGTGMPPSIFKALQNEQLNFTSSLGTAKEKGTGLGLLLVREFLHKNNGTLTIKTEQGNGSTFSVILPDGGSL